MKNLKIDKEIILERIDIIEKSLKRLEASRKLTSGQFILDENFAIAEHYLRYALEAVFDICAHILSRIPGVKIDEYKKMAIEMAKQKIVPVSFAAEKLEKMAGYRNRLTYFYFEVSPSEMYKIICQSLTDFEIFLKHIKKILKNNRD